MLQKQRHGLERSNRGYSLVEVAAVVAVMAILFSIVLGGYQARINKAKLERTVGEMMSLAQASLDFYNSQGIWPAAPINLAPTFMYTAVTLSPFGGNYQISGLNKAVTISTTVPSGLAQKYYQGTLLVISRGVLNDTIGITQQLPNELSGRLEYEKKYTYRQ